MSASPPDAKYGTTPGARASYRLSALGFDCLPSPFLVVPSFRYGRPVHRWSRPAPRRTRSRKGRRVDVGDLLRAHGGCMRASQIEAYTSRRAIRTAVAAGVVLRIGVGSYALPEADRRTSTAFRLRGVLSHRSAAAHWGFALLPGPDVEHVSIPRHSRRARTAGVVIHYRSLSTADIDAGVTSPVQTVLDCLRDLPFAEALAVGDSALRSGAVRPRELVSATSTLRGPGSRRVRGRMRWLDPRAENAFESSCRAILIEGGVSGFVPQLAIRHDGRFLGRVDLGNELLMIVVECESFAYHGDRAALRRDCRRYTDLEAAGWRVIRVSWEHVMFDRAWVLSRVRDVVAVASRSAERAPDGTEVRTESTEQRIGAPVVRADRAGLGTAPASRAALFRLFRPVASSRNGHGSGAAHPR